MMVDDAGWADRTDEANPCIDRLHDIIKRALEAAFRTPPFQFPLLPPNNAQRPEIKASFRFD
jgi:hypothetical protein